MPYITPSGLVARYGETELVQLTDVMGDGAMDSARVDQAIADADALIDAYLAGRVALPLDPVPAILTRIAGVIARYTLYDDAMPDVVEDQYQAAIKFLEAVASGKATLGPGPDGEAAPATGAPSFAARPSVFADGMKGY
jgi:phage gp36-like protein